MTFWNYRVIRKNHRKTDSCSYHIHEVYYDDENNIESWTRSPVEPMGETLAELRGDIHFFLKAFQKPVLIETNRDGKDTLTEDEESIEKNEDHYHEILDRSWVATEYLNQFIGNHPIIKRNKDLFEIYMKAESAISELYQNIGRLIND